MQTTASRASTAVVATTVAGNARDFFDFITCAFSAVYIGEAFFPSRDSFLSLLASGSSSGHGTTS
jgi:hypothetical protein